MTEYTSPLPRKNEDTSAGQAFVKLLDVMAKLRDPVTGCPWDVEQSFATIAPYTIEEAYEVADAIDRGHMGDLKEELGDLLFQVAFHSQLASEDGLFTAADVADAIASKMIRRHPHVFAAADDRSAHEQTAAWEVMKEQERAAKASNSALDGVALALPALQRAEKLQKRAARTGFDWTTPEPIFEKLDEEIAEVHAAIASGVQADIEDELGDLLFVCANLARRLNVDPEQALRRANAKFEKRFKAMEEMATGQGLSFAALSLEEQDDLWNTVKAAQRDDG